MDFDQFLGAARTQKLVEIHNIGSNFFQPLIRAQTWVFAQQILNSKFSVGVKVI